MEADGACKWKQNEDFEDMARENADIAEEQDVIENLMPAQMQHAEEQKLIEEGKKEEE